MLFFSGKGGLSGDIWLATMLSVLDDDSHIERLRENLPWMEARLETKTVDGKKESRIYIKGAENSPKQTWSEMRDFLLQTNFETEVKKKALEVLEARQYWDARGVGFSLEQMRYSGKGVGDTLFDILGGVYFWHLLGSPAVGLTGYLDVGYFPPLATRKLLANIPNKTPRQERELTTPTAAALLQVTYREIEEPRRDPDLIVVSGGKFADEGRVSKTLAHYYA